MVYVPTSLTRPAKVIVYLHGGVDSHDDFGDDDPQVRDEPIFAAADSINTTDDNVYPYKEVIKYYDAQKGVATGWHFQTLPSGGHGFIYAPGGNYLLLQYVRDLIMTPLPPSFSPPHGSP